MTDDGKFEADDATVLRQLMASDSSIGVSIADLIDNSIDAGASKVFFDICLSKKFFHPHEHADITTVPYFYVIDNGKGISKADLPRVMSIIKRTDGYKDVDLGAFGFGVPQSTMSHGSEITIISKQKGESIHQLHYSITHFVLDKETMDIKKPDETPPNFITETEGYILAYEEIDKIESGTAILVNGCYNDRWTKNDKDDVSKDHLIKVGTCVQDYLALVFHRFMSDGGVELVGPDGSKRKVDLKIRRGKKPVKPLDPVLLDYKGKGTPASRGTLVKKAQILCVVKDVQRFADVVLAVIPSAEKEGHGIRPMKHDLRMLRAINMRDSAGGYTSSRAITDCQGIYSYRNERLIGMGFSWGKSYKVGANYTDARMQIFTPTGTAIAVPTGALSTTTTTESFSVDEKKRQLSIVGSDVDEKFQSLLESKYKWHTLDSKKVVFRSRATNRATFDKEQQPKPPKTKPTITVVPSTKNGKAPLSVNLDLKSSGSPKAVSWKISYLGNVEQTERGAYTVEFTEPGTHTVAVQGFSGKGNPSDPQKFNVIVFGDEDEPSETDDEPGGGGEPEDSSVELTGPAGLVTIQDDSNGGVRYTFDPDHLLYAELKKLA